MTTTTHTVAAMLSVAVAALEAQNKAHKSETGEVLYALGQDMGNGVKFRELKSWAKDFKAKQAEVAPKAAPKTAAVKTPAAAPKTPAAKPAAEVVELKATEVRDQIVLIGRAKETVTRIVKDKETEQRLAVTDKGTRILLADIERNNRGNLRVTADAIEKYVNNAPVAPAPKAAAKTPAAKPAAKVSAKKPAAEEFEAETNTRRFPVRHLEISKSSNLVSAEYDRNDQTLIVVFKDGAVWAYEGVKLSEAKALETAESSGKHFIANIRDVKTGKMVKSGSKAAPAAKTEAKASAKTPAPKATAKAAPKADAVEFTGNDLRGAVYMNGRKAETIGKVVKGTDGARYVVTEEGTRVAVSSLRKNNRGKFVADEVAPAPKATAKPAAKVAAAKPAENARKTTGNKKADFAKAEAAPKKMHTVAPLPTISDVKDAEVRVTKGSKETMAKILRVVNREGVRYAVTENRFPLPFNQIIFMDGQLTYTGKPLTAEEFRAL